ncbi:MAG: hypothetical protein IJM15_05285 [Erysipelotrichaceae bacterium]|nr:hypothetical protein [Erysipelotrichaceae bacterium]
MKLNEERITKYLNDHVGEEITSFLLVKETGACEKDADKLEIDELFEIDEEVRRIAKASGYWLDMRKHANKCEGLPFVLDFKIRRKKTTVK